MARQETDREDLMREATALVNRVALRREGTSEETVIGFRTEGTLSIYLGSEPVYQFNTDHELRRGYYEGCLIKANQRLLVSMRRHRESGSLQLLSTTWDLQQTQRFIERVQLDLTQLVDEIRTQRSTVIDFVAAQQEVRADSLLSEFCLWCDHHLAGLRVALSPHVSA